MTNLVGKPYAGKLHVRFDEGATGQLVPRTLLYWQKKAKPLEVVKRQS